MVSMIYELQEYGNRELRKLAEYTLPADKALVCYVEQMSGNMATWQYPDTLDGMRESPIVPGVWYYDDLSDIQKPRVLAAYPI